MIDCNGFHGGLAAIALYKVTATEHHEFLCIQKQGG